MKIAIKKYKMAFAVPLTLSLGILLLISSCSFNYKYFHSKEITKAARKDTVLQVDDMVFVPGGWFLMGSPKRSDEKPQHRVYVNSFYMDKTEVTVADYRRFCSATRRRMPVQPEWSSDDHPVVNVSWKNALAYARWMGKRLPTEAEWEYAARAKSSGYAYQLRSDSYLGQSFGNIADESILRVKGRFPIKSRYDDGYIYSAPVASFAPNPFGIYDMEGNVLEWCMDWYDRKYYASATATYNPQGPASGNYKVIRGASWNRSGSYLRTTYRTWYNPACTFKFLGFRCVQDYNPPQNHLASND